MVSACAIADALEEIGRGEYEEGLELSLDGGRKAD